MQSISGEHPTSNIYRGSQAVYASLQFSIVSPYFPLSVQPLSPPSIPVAELEAVNSREKGKRVQEITMRNGLMADGDGNGDVKMKVAAGHEQSSNVVLVHKCMTSIASSNTFHFVVFLSNFTVLVTPFYALRLHAPTPVFNPVPSRLFGCTGR